MCHTLYNHHVEFFNTFHIVPSVLAGYPSKMPNYHRALAEGEPIYTSFIDYFGDDVSGNRSKSWNKHNNTYITHRNLPRKLLQQRAHTHFISTSQHATLTEQYHDFKKVVDSTHKKPIRIVNAQGHGTRFLLQVHVGPSDNPAKSDVAGHIGSKGNHPCRKCDVGGNQESKETNEGFHAMFSVSFVLILYALVIFYQPGNPHTAEKIKEELNAQVQLACRGVAKPIAERQTNSGTKDGYTQYWIDYLLQRFRDTKQLNPGKPAAEIEAELLTWVDENKTKLYSSFLFTKGGCAPSVNCAGVVSNAIHFRI